MGYAGASNTLSVLTGGSVQTRFANVGADATSTSNVVNVSRSGMLGAPAIIGNQSGAFVHFNHNGNSLDFTPALTGTLAVVHDGTGSTTITGAGSNFGAVTVNGGTLDLGTLSSSAATVGNNGTLAVHSGDTASVSGNYDQAGTGVLRTHVGDDTTFGRMNVTSSATIPPNARQPSYSATLMARILLQCSKGNISNATPSRASVAGSGTSPSSTIARSRATGPPLTMLICGPNPYW